MTATTTPEDLIKLNFGPLAAGEACGCEGACACGSQTIEFHGLTIKTTPAGSGQTVNGATSANTVACC